MTLARGSPAFAADAPIPPRFSHEHGDVSPALAWDGVPTGIAELVLLVDDPDAPMEGSFVHWVLCGLDPSRDGLAEGEVAAEGKAGAKWIRRCRLAVDQSMELTGAPSYHDVEAAVAGHVLAEARLIGTYRR